jgi:hypothetical protein
MRHYRRTTCGLGILGAVLVLGCRQESAEPPAVLNPLLELDVEQVREVRFVGTSSPIPGNHFASADRAFIGEVFARAAALRPADPSHITMPGNITFIRLLAADETLLAEISVGGDGRTVVLHGPQDARKTVIAASPDFCRYCFGLLKTRALHVLQAMLTLDDRGNRELHLKSYPFDTIPPTPEPPQPVE